MSLSFVGPAGSVEQRWIVYALLRDNIQHHLEGGQPSGDFTNIHALATALAGAGVKVPARGLRAELERAKQELGPLPFSELAVSARTRAVLAFDWPPPEARATTLLREWGQSIPLLGGPYRTLEEVFGHLVDALLSITDGAVPADLVEAREL